MFIFDQDRLSTESARGILGKYVCPLIPGTAIELEGSKVLVRCPELKYECAKNGTSLTFDSKYDFLVFIMVFETNNPIINSIYNIRRE